MKSYYDTCMELCRANQYPESAEGYANLLIAIFPDYYARMGRENLIREIHILFSDNHPRRD